MQKLLTASLLLASCALQPAHAQKAHTHRPALRQVPASQPHASQATLADCIMVDFCEAYERYYDELPSVFSHYTNAVLHHNPSTERAGTLARALITSPTLRQAVYKSIYQFCYDDKYGSDTKQGVNEVMHELLYDSFHLNTSSATTLTAYIIGSYKQPYPTNTLPTEEAERTAADPSPNEEALTKKEYTYVEQMPALPGGGGMGAIVAAINHNLHYPAEDIQNKVEGKVLATMTVDETGQVGNVKIQQGLSATLNAEAVRAIQTLPKFIPGKQNGQAVAVSFTVPVNFRLPTSTSPTTTP